MKIFGLVILKSKEFDEMKRDIDSIKATMKNLVEISTDACLTAGHANSNVIEYMDFVMRRLPLKRQRKEARKRYIID